MANPLALLQLVRDARTLQASFNPSTSAQILAKLQRSCSAQHLRAALRRHPRHLPCAAGLVPPPSSSFALC